ncbi:MAG: hypothetical protein Q4C37_03295 [Bacteroidales bacterium]|nr:hypothetical protein [Bacteroidales bacterium]
MAGFDLNKLQKDYRVDRKTQTLSTGGNDQDVKAMLELYADLVDQVDPQADQEKDKSDQETTLTDQETIQADQETTQRGKNTTQTTTQTDHKTTRTGDKIHYEPQNGSQNSQDEPQNCVQEVHEPQNELQRLLDTVRTNYDNKSYRTFPESPGF